MERIAYNRLIEWKNSPERKPLIVHGARQVGKTWLLKELGRREYASLVYVNCDKEPAAATWMSGASSQKYLSAAIPRGAS